MTNIRQLYVDWIGETINRFDGKVGPRFRHPQKYAKLEPHCKEQFIDLSQQNWDNVYVWSDLHFGHKNIIRFSDRPFGNIYSMEAGLIDNFNETVGPDDISIWVGDVAFQPDSETNRLLKRLNGYKILIIGNHDFNHGKLRKLDFDETHLLMGIENDHVSMCFTHFPMGNLPKDIINVHGHQHVGCPHWTDDSAQHINVNCEFHDYKPVSLSQIAKWARMRHISMEL